MATYNKVCECCGNTFISKGAHGKYCSVKCKRQGNREYRRAYDKARREKNQKKKGLDNALKELGCVGYIEKQKQDTINKYARVIV